MSRTVLSNVHEILSELCRLRKQWGIFLYCAVDQEVSLQDIQKAAPWFSDDLAAYFALDSGAYVFFDSQMEMDAAYYRTVGDDGPSPSNPYDGPAKVYALTCSPTGTLRTENT